MDLKMFKPVFCIICFVFLLASCSDEASNTADDKELYYIIIQEGLNPDSSYAGCSDTSINSVSPALNYGVSDTLNAGSDSSGIYRSLIKFDLSTIALPAGAKIEKAFLSLYASGYSASNSYNIGIYKVSNYWTEGSQNGSSGAANWNQRMSGLNWSNQGGDYSDLLSDTHKPVSSSYFVNFSIDANYIQEMFRTLSSNASFMLKALDENSTVDSLVYFCSSEYYSAGFRPKLTIYYTIE